MAQTTWKEQLKGLFCWTELGGLVSERGGLGSSTECSSFKHPLGD